MPKKKSTTTLRVRFEIFSGKIPLANMTRYNIAFDRNRHSGPSVPGLRVYASTRTPIGSCQIGNTFLTAKFKTISCTVNTINRRNKTALHVLTVPNTMTRNYGPDNKRDIVRGNLWTPSKTHAFAPQQHVHPRTSGSRNSLASPGKILRNVD